MSHSLNILWTLLWQVIPCPSLWRECFPPSATSTQQTLGVWLSNLWAAQVVMLLMTLSHVLEHSIWNVCVKSRRRIEVYSVLGKIWVFLWLGLCLTVSPSKYNPFLIWQEFKSLHLLVTPSFKYSLICQCQSGLKEFNQSQVGLPSVECEGDGREELSPS